MKVLAFNGSPRKKGNTFQAIEIVAGELAQHGIDTEIINVGLEKIRGCTACNWCAKTGEGRCVYNDDHVNEWIAKMREADGIILGSPVYFAGINGTLKAFLDRAGYVLARDASGLRHKVGTAVVAVRRSGGTVSLDELNRYLNYFEMFTPSSNYWNVIHGMMPGEIHQDEEGVEILKVLGRNMAWLMKAVDCYRQQCPLPEREPKPMTNFIR